MWKKLEHQDSREILCSDHPQRLTVSTGSGYKTLEGRIHCLYHKVTHRLYAATNRSIFDHREQTLRLHTSQLALIQDPTVHWVYCFASHHGKIWRKQWTYFRAQHLALVYIDESSCGHVNSAQSAMSFRSGNINKNFWKATFFTKIVKH